MQKELEEGQCSGEEKNVDELERMGACSVAGQKSVGKQVLLLLLFMEQVHLLQRKMHAKRVSFSGVFLFMCMHIMDSCVCIHFSVGWLSLGFGSLGATEIQTDVNNIEAGM